MKRALAGVAVLFLSMVTGLLVGRPAQAASLVQVTGFGANPSNLQMYLYVPDRVAARPAVLVAVHYCTGSGPAFFSGTQFASLADQFGFIVVYPSATRSGSCFDVSTSQALTRNGGSDPVGIKSMVDWVVANRNADASRVYVTGASSGGMMTNVLLADYPDVFKAGAAFMGVPYTCFATSDPSMWNNQCANGQINRTAQQWGDAVRNNFPGFGGARPRMQLWHGTADTTLNFNNFGEEIEQWTNALGVSQTPFQTDTPQSGWTRTRYGSAGNVQVEAYRIEGVGHSLPLSGQARLAIDFFGLSSTTTDTTPPTMPGTPVASNVSSTSATLAWTPSTDNVGVTGYDILRATGATGGTFTQVGTSTSSTFQATGLTASTTYRFQVRARDAAGNVSAVSNAVTVTTQAGTGDTQAPTAPTGLAASGTTQTGTSLAWTASTDNVGVTGYDVLQATGATGGTFTQVGTSTTTSFAVTGLTANTTYRFQVRARDAAGNMSAVSNTAQITTQGGGQTGACTATPTVQSQWATGYVINPLTITNTSTSTINGWTVTFTLPAGHTLAGSWNATVTTSGQTVTVKPVSFNSTIAPGASITSFGFQVNRPNGDTQMPPTYTCTSP